MGRVQNWVDRALYRDLPDINDTETTEPQLRGVMKRMGHRLIGESAVSAAVFFSGYGLTIWELWQRGGEASQGKIAAELGIALVGATAEVVAVTQTWGRHHQYENEIIGRHVHEARTPTPDSPNVLIYEFTSAAKLAASWVDEAASLGIRFS